MGVKEWISLTVTVFLLALSAIQFIKMFLNSKRIKLDPEASPAEPQTVNAKVISTDSDIVYKGIKYPEHKIQFSVQFLLNDGKKLEFYSDSPVFDGLNSGDSGLLTFCGKRYICFSKNKE